jgi:hypothetical protein
VALRGQTLGYGHGYFSRRQADAQDLPPDLDLAGNLVPEAALVGVPALRLVAVWKASIVWAIAIHHTLNHVLRFSSRTAFGSSSLL